MAITVGENPAAVTRLAHPDDLGLVLAEAFGLFARGVADRRSAFRTPTMATVRSDGTPSLCTMVLRRFSPTARCLMLHTDQRSSKLPDLAAMLRVVVHVYDAHAALQIRLTAAAKIHTGDDIAHAAWAASAPSSRVGYAVSPAPGTEIGPK